MKALFRVCLALSFPTGIVCTAQQTTPPQMPEVSAAVAATRSQIAAILDSFVKEASTSGLKCAIKPPVLVVADVPSFGSYDPGTNTLTTPAWEQMTTDEQAIFYRGVGSNTNEAAARAEFELGVHHWVIVHELGHWWQACRGMVDNGDHYNFEFNANRIAAAYWNQHDPAVNAHQQKVFQTILEKWPNPVPDGQSAIEYFNKNYEALAPTRAYIWFQAQMCTKAFSETPLPSFSAALTRIKSN